MSKTILIVDDAPTMRQMVSFTLKSKNYSVVEASDGEEALEKLQNGLRPDMVITDLNMPGMDGISLIRAIRGLPGQRYIPILMLTTESMEERKKEGQAAGATGWIVKPFTPEQLLKVVCMVMP